MIAPLFSSIISSRQGHSSLLRALRVFTQAVEDSQPELLHLPCE